MLTIPDRRTGQHEPMFNLPAVVVWTVLVLLAIHLLRQLISVEDDLNIILRFAFIPARYAGLPGAEQIFPPGDPAEYWTPISYGFLHASWEHLILNTLWLVVFGSAVAWRFGQPRFIVFLLLCTAAGAAIHLVAHWAQLVPMVGASAGISGLTAAAVRFVFEAGGPLGAFRSSVGRYAFLQPAAPFLDSLKNPRVFFFLAVWFALTILFGAVAVPGAPGSGAIAWEAHVGGFLAGLVLFPLVDPVPRRSVV